MARKTIVELIDDIDGSPADTTVRFGWRGASYEIDLSNRNVRAFDAAIDTYLKAATRVTGGGRSGGRRSSSRSKVDLSGIRAWAAKNGHAIASRGRIPSGVIDAYNTAQRATPATAAARSVARPRKAPAKKAAAGKAPARKVAARRGSGRR